MDRRNPCRHSYDDCDLANRPSLYASLIARPWTWALVLGIVGALIGIFTALKEEGTGCVPVLGWLGLHLGSTAAGLYPNLLTSTLDPSYDLNISNAQAGGIGLRVGFYWWTLALVLAVGLLYSICSGYSGAR